MEPHRSNAGPSSADVGEALERDSQWLHRLAGALTRDPELASDAAQNTLLRAWRSAPRVEGGAGPSLPQKRSWLARVLSNSIREEVRATGTRRGKEQDAARPEAVEDGVLGLQRLELQRHVVEALEALAEPYRTTLVLRFLDGLSARAIAARTGVETKTVYTRLERGLAELRSRLDRRFEGDRTTWVSALLALPPAGGRWTPVLTGAGIMSTGMKITLGVALVATGVLAVLRASSGDSARTLAAVETADRPAELGEVDRIETPASRPPANAAETRTALDPEQPSAIEPAPAAAPEAAVLVSIEGRVLDTLGRPLEDVGVGWRADSGSAAAMARSDRSGRFTFSSPIESLPKRVTIVDPDFAAARESYVRRESHQVPLTLVAAPALGLEGVVVDAAGNPLAGAAVVAASAQSLVQFPGVLDTTTRAESRTTSDERGRFQLERVPIFEGAYAYARRLGYDGPDVALTPEVAEAGLRLVLHVADAPDSPQATGTVYLPDGQPAAGALVRYGQARTQTAADGTFALELAYDPLPEQVLAAGLDGYAPAFVERYGELQHLSAPHAPSPVVLSLGAEALSIRGIIVDADGAPQPDWEVAFEGGLEITRWQTPPVLLERLDSLGATARTGPDGRFELTGLLPREYTVTAFHPATLVGVRPERVFAGERDLRLVAPSDALHDRLTGSLHSSSGAPVEGARVTAARVSHRTETGYSWKSGKTVFTLADGSFELQNVPRADLALNIHGENVVPKFVELEPGFGPEGHHIEVELRRHFRVEVQGDELDGLSIRVVDAEAQPLSISSFSAFGSSSGTSHRLEDGRMETAAVSERAAFVVLLRNGAEIARRELVFVPGEVCAIGFEL